MTSDLDKAKGDVEAVLHMDIVEDDEGLSNAEILMRGLRFGAWLLAFLFAMATIGIIPTIAIFVVAFMRLEGRERWSLVLPIAAGMTLFVYVVFDQLLRFGLAADLSRRAYPSAPGHSVRVKPRQRAPHDTCEHLDFEFSYGVRQRSD